MYKRATSDEELDDDYYRIKNHYWGLKDPIPSGHKERGYQPVLNFSAQIMTDDLINQEAKKKLLLGNLAWAKFHKKMLPNEDKFLSRTTAANYSQVDTADKLIQDWMGKEIKQDIAKHVGIGAGLGAVAGGGIGYLTGNALGTNSLIGAGIGAGLGATAGGVLGYKASPNIPNYPKGKMESMFKKILQSDDLSDVPDDMLMGLPGLPKDPVAKVDAIINHKYLSDKGKQINLDKLKNSLPALKEKYKNNVRKLKDLQLVEKKINDWHNKETLNRSLLGAGIGAGAGALLGSGVGYLADNTLYYAPNISGAVSKFFTDNKKASIIHGLLKYAGSVKVGC